MTQSNEQSDFNDRRNKLITAYGKLIQELKVDFVHFPVFMPDDNGAFKVVIQSSVVDTSRMSTPSPFVAK